MDNTVSVKYPYPGLPVAVTEHHNVNPLDQVNRLHTHKEWQFTVVLRGSISYLVRDVIITAEAGQCLFVNSGVAHYALPVAGEDTDVQMCYIDPELFSGSKYIWEEYILPLTQNPALHCFIIPKHNPIQKYINSIYQLSENHGPYLPLDMMNLAAGIMKTLVFDATDDMPGGDMRRGFRELKRMLDAITQRYSENIGLADLAEAGGVSKNTCILLFKKYLGASPVNYLTSYRLRCASDLLINGSLPVTQIAYATGFTSSSYFTKRFREFYGMTPREFRSSAKRGELK